MFIVTKTELLSRGLIVVSQVVSDVVPVQDVSLLQLIPLVTGPNHSDDDAKM
jgi:hypothetical protein